MTSLYTVAVTSNSPNRRDGMASRSSRASAIKGPLSATSKGANIRELAVKILDAVAHHGNLAPAQLVDHLAVRQTGDLGGQAQAQQVALIERSASSSRSALDPAAWPSGSVSIIGSP